MKIVNDFLDSKINFFSKEQIIFLKENPNYLSVLKRNLKSIYDFNNGVKIETDNYILDIIKNDNYKNSLKDKELQEKLTNDLLFLDVYKLFKFTINNGYL